MKSFLLTTFAACTSAWFAPSSSRSGDMARRLGPRRAIDQADREAMQAAIALAKRSDRTYPNPAVGCIVVGATSDGNGASGQGWHPRAGWPHAEIYALADFSGLLPLDQRIAVLPPAPPRAASSANPPSSPVSDDATLLAAYQLQGAQLFQGAAAGATAYVTLEPCSHAQGSPVDGSTCNNGGNSGSGNPAPDSSSATTVEAAVATTVTVAATPEGAGAAASTTAATATTVVKKKSTPPCAGALVASGVARVVIGCRDPNPRVDGGGVATLEAAGIEVEVMNGPEAAAAKALISDFATRIRPASKQDPPFDPKGLNAKERAVLRRLWSQAKKAAADEIAAGSSTEGGKNSPKKKCSGKKAAKAREIRIVVPEAAGAAVHVAEAVHASQAAGVGSSSAMEAAAADLANQLEASLEPEWLAEADRRLLHQSELLTVRIAKAPSKRIVTALAAAAANQLNAAVAQVVGHTALLYRPSSPPVIDLASEVAKSSSGANEE